MSTHAIAEPIPDYSPSSPDDLNEIVGVIMRVPAAFMQVGGSLDNAAFDATLQAFRQDIEERLPSLNQGRPPELTQPLPYQIGPAVGATLDFIIACLQHADHLIHSTSDYLTWGGFALAVGRLWRQRVRQLHPEYGVSEREALVFPRCLIEALCLKDLQDRYGLSSRTSLQAHSRDPFYTEGRRPTGCSVHTIAIRMGGKSYFYMVNGRGTVIEHFMLDGIKVIPLTLPDWFPPPY